MAHFVGTSCVPEPPLQPRRGLTDQDLERITHASAAARAPGTHRICQYDIERGFDHRSSPTRLRDPRLPSDGPRLPGEELAKKDRQRLRAMVAAVQEDLALLLEVPNAEISLVRLVKAADL